LYTRLEWNLLIWSRCREHTL